jgi:hypothetical protein
VPFAVGFGILGAAAAAAAYGSPPQPGMCWYCDDPSQTTGHWDYCCVDVDLEGGAQASLFFAP